MTRLAPIAGGWLGSKLRPGQWRLAVPPSVRRELLDRARSGSPPNEPFAESLPETAAFGQEIRRRLRFGNGFVVLTGFPVDEPERVVERLYLLLALQLGCPVSQSHSLDFIGRVEDRGSDIASPTQRGYKSAAALPFHCDRTDLIGLLCIRPAHSGGCSRLASSVAVHNLLLEENPELLRELYKPLPNDRRGEEGPEESPWTPLPVFSICGSRLSTRYVRRFIEGSQRHPGAPRLTEVQLEALDAIDDILERPGVSLDMDLRPGDLQLIDNFSILHARTAFEDATGERARLLLRLWLAVPESAELPPAYADLYGATGPGTYRGGVWPPDRRPSETGHRVADLRHIPTPRRRGLPEPSAR